MLEYQNLKRKRAGSASPPPPQIKLLTRSQETSLDQQPAPSPARTESPSSKQPAPKRSRNRKDRWANVPTTNANASTTNVNVDGYDGRDPVLHSVLTSFQHKADIITQINVSADHLKLGGQHELGFHRAAVEDQAKVIRKANAYAELIVTSNCRYKMPEQTKGKRANYVKAYLDGMTKTEVTELKNDTKQALDLEDTNRSMAVYRYGDDLLERVRTSCFTVGQQKLLPKDAYKPIDERRGLHTRLAFTKLYYCIPVRFYYAKWLEKLDYYLRNNPSRERSLTPSHSSIASSFVRTWARYYPRSTVVPVVVPVFWSSLPT